MPLTRARLELVLIAAVLAVGTSSSALAQARDGGFEHRLKPHGRVAGMGAPDLDRPGLDRPGLDRAVPTVERYRFEPPTGFYDRHFLPRVRRGVARLQPIIDDNRPDQPISDSLLYQQVNDRASSRLRSATGGALRDYLRETTVLGRLTSFRLGRKGRDDQPRDEAEGIVRPRRRSTRIDLRLSSGESRVSVGRDSSIGFMRFSIGTEGTVGFSVSGVHGSRSTLFAEYGPVDQEIRVAGRWRF